MSSESKRRNKARAGVGLLWVAFTLSGIAQADEAKPARLFEREDTLTIEMTAPWRELVRAQGSDEAWPATMSYIDELGNAQTLELEVERRGLTRQRICKIPPIKLKFAKGAAKGTTFRGQESLKMVTHCESRDRYEEYYVLEMLAYRMYNLFTDFSFKVRPLTVTYYQVGHEEEQGGFFRKKTQEGPVFAFLIEEDKDVGNRHNLKNLHIPRIPASQLDSDTMGLFSLFQFMIGNVDWAATSGPDPRECCHNVKLIGPEPTHPEDTLYAVPYDFDSAGLVDSEYAAPPDGLPIRDVTQRLYRGYCAHNAALPGAREAYLAREQQIYDLVRNENRLHSSRQDKTIRFLEEFFEVLRDDEAFREEVVDACRG